MLITQSNLKCFSWNLYLKLARFSPLLFCKKIIWLVLHPFILQSYIIQVKGLHKVNVFFYQGCRGSPNNFGWRECGRSHPGGCGRPKQCTLYSRLGHIVEHCYFKHGFPPCYKSRYQFSTKSRSASEGNTSSNVETFFPKAVSHDAPGAPLSEQLKQILNLLQQYNIG